MLAFYEFWTRLYENYFVCVRVLENSVRLFENFLVIVRVYENFSVLVRLFKNGMESGSSFMKNLWNLVRLHKIGSVILKMFCKIVRLFENILILIPTNRTLSVQISQLEL